MRALICLCLLFLPLRPAWAPQIQELTSPGGIAVWLVEDYSVPLISLDAALPGGVSLDPQGKEGLANLLASLLGEGAGKYNAQQFAAALEDNAIGLEFSAGRDAVNISLSTLSEHRALAFDLLQLAIAEPHLDEAALERVRGQILAELAAAQSDPDWLAARSFNGIVLGNHPYGQPGKGRAESLANINREDLRRHAPRLLQQSGIKVAVAGAISAAELLPLLDQVFGRLPKNPPPLLAMAEPQQLGKTILLQRDLPQTTIIMGQPAPRPDDADWYALQLVNYVLGGGGFSARLMQEVREKQGLTYGVGTSLSVLRANAMLMLNAATDNDKADAALRLIRQQWQQLAEEGMSADELQAAKSYLIGALPLSLTSNQQISGLLLGLMWNGYPSDYLDRFAGNINAVSLDAANAAAARWLRVTQLVTVLVGAPSNSHPDIILSSPP